MRKGKLILINPCPKCGGEPERVATWYADGKNVARTTGQEAVKAWNRLR